MQQKKWPSIAFDICRYSVCGLVAIVQRIRRRNRSAAPDGTGGFAAPLLPEPLTRVHERAQRQRRRVRKLLDDQTRHGSQKKGPLAGPLCRRWRISCRRLSLRGEQTATAHVSTQTIWRACHKQIGCKFHGGYANWVAGTSVIWTNSVCSFRFAYRSPCTQTSIPHP